MYCIETTGLSYRFSKKETVLTDLNLQIPEGAIYGFLGANGAGKTTTLRLLLGLLRRQEGSVRIFGQQFDNERIAILQKIGSLIEMPSVYGHLTAAENLEVWRRIYNCPKDRIADVLETVQLSETGFKKARMFSLGMKQRLGIAIALLNNSALLILDEPTNGLDPNGIIEMRELLRRLNQEQGMTILISSHMLTEVERLVTHAGIIHRGKMLFQGTMEELQKVRSNTESIGFDTSDAAATMKIMKANGLEPTLLADGQVAIPYTDKSMIAILNQQLVEHRISIFRVGMQGKDLESIFIDLTKN